MVEYTFVVVWLCCCAATVGGIIYGYHLGRENERNNMKKKMSESKEFIKEWFNMMD
jgi:membrane protein YqaA with SNARE-associated domain